MTETQTIVKPDSAQYLTFVLAGELFALNILNTREVLMLVKITPIPETPDYMAGVINLRGSVVPVLDLRRKFRMPETAGTDTASIIIVEIIRDGEILVVGALVDAVRGVLRFDREQIEAPPKIGMKLNTELIDALARKDNGFVIILNVNRIFAEDELERLETAARGDGAGTP